MQLSSLSDGKLWQYQHRPQIYQSPLVHTAQISTHKSCEDEFPRVIMVMGYALTNKTV